jgi:D-alanine-D-alanine ligase
MHKALGCKGVSRSDFRYDPKQNRVVFLELNANPGMTNLSLVPEMALQKGISYNNLVNMLVEKADFER